ncbi:hypothetical protein MIR68_009648 [Amoeboaphelidium protococcarum]|nr:hypothetical protein MIR68_009648 [Amoeboaphelidium protococcarum]
MNKFTRRWRAMWSALSIIVAYIVADNRRNQKSFTIGCSTVLVVVLFLTIIQNILNQSNIIFLRLAEEQVGSFDFAVTADNSIPNTENFLVNYTDLSLKTQGLSIISGISPRWILRANVTSNNGESQSEGDVATFAGTGASTIVLVANTTLEKQIGLSTLWPHRKLGYGECHVSSSLLRALGVRPSQGEQLSLSIGLQSLANGQGIGGIQSPIAQPPSPASSAVPQSDAPSPPPAVDPSNDQTVPGGNQTTTPDSSSSDNPIGSGNIPPVIEIPQSSVPPALQQELVNNYNATIINGTLYLNTTTLIDRLQRFNQFNVNFECSVIDAIDSPSGVYPQSLGNVVYIEQDFAQQIIDDYLNSIASQLLQLRNPLIPTPQIQIPSNIDIEYYAMLAAIVLKDRGVLYMQDEDGRSASIMAASNAIMSTVGVDYPIQLTDVLNQALSISQFIQIFLSEVFFTIVVVLIVLAFILITSLMTSDAEEKTFEYGMLRMLGLHSSSLIVLLIFQSLLFSIPAVVFGLLLCYMFYIPIAYYLSLSVGVFINLNFAPSAIALGLICGLLLPIIGTVVPIRRSLSQTVRNALDMYHNSAQDSTLNIKRLEEIGLSLNQTAIAIFLVVAGFIVYYLIPLSFIFGDLSMFFRIMTVILLGMVFGLTIVFQAVERYLSVFLVRVMTFIALDSSLTEVIIKNMNAHAPRNRKTAVMFTLCIGYIIFASTMFTLQISSLNQSVEWFLGADVVISGPSYQLPLPEMKLRQALTQLLPNSSAPNYADRIVAGFTFVTYPINQAPTVTGTSFHRLAYVSAATSQVYGVEENFLDVALREYAVPSQVNYADYQFTYVNGQPDVVRALFSNVSQQAIQKAPADVGSNAQQDNFGYYQNTSQAYQDVIPVLISESVRDKATVDAQSRLILNIFFTAVYPNQRSYLAMPVAMLQKMPYFSQINRLITSQTPVLVSMNHYAQFIEDVETAVDSQADGSGSGGGGSSQRTFLQDINVSDVVKGTCLVKMIGNATDLQVQAFVNQMNSLLANDKFTVQNLRSQKAANESATSLINVLFVFVALIGVLLSFFVLLLSFTANVRENSWQLGVLRAIGLASNTVIKIFIYEAVAIVLSCAILGLILGLLTASTLTLQSNLFSELPFKLIFPTLLFFVVLLMSIGLAIFGSYIPINSFNKKPIAVALKGL